MIPVSGNATIAGYAGASPTAASSVALGSVTIISLPERLMALARPFTITATSAGQRGENIVILRTQYGQVLVETDFSVPGNRPLSLTIGVGNPPLKGQLALVATASKGEGSAAQVALPGPGTATSAANVAELKPGMIVRAMTAGPMGTEPARTMPINLASLAAIALPAPPPVATRAAPSVSETAWRLLQAPLIAQSAAEATPRSAPPMPLALPASAQPSQSLSLRIVQIAPPPSASGGVLPADPSIARVVNTTLAGQPIVQLDNEVLVLDTQHRLAKGTLLFVERVTPSPLGASASAEEASNGRNAAPWSPIAEVMNALTRAELPAMASLRTQLQPNHAQFSGTLLFLIAALRLGDPKTLLGERGIDALTKSGRGELIDRLRDAARKSSTTMVDSSQGEWRGQSLPMLDGDAIVPVQFAFRRPDDQPNEEDAASGPRAQRFTVDLSPSQLGNLQLEGLVSGARFDLVVRTEQALSESLAADLVAVFTRSLKEAGMTGALSIHTDGKAFLKLKNRNEEVGLVA